MTQLVGQCKLCGRTEKLVKSHVVPKALHLDAQPEFDTMTIYSQAVAYGKRSPSGVYGRFLCRDCEELFGPYDMYGVEFVKTYKTGVNGAPLSGSFKYGFTADIDYPKLKLWIMSMLWRADACDHGLFGRVNLGKKWRDILASNIRSQTPGNADIFSVTASLFDEGEYGQLFMADPHPERFSGVNYYRFYIYGGFTFFVKVDQRKQPAKLEPLSMSEVNQLVVIRRIFSKSEKKLMGLILGK